MFKRLNTEMLKEDNYIETLAYIATRLLKYKTAEARENEAYRIDSALWALSETARGEAYGTDSLLRVSTAIEMLISASYKEA